MIRKWIVVSIFVGMGAVCLLGFTQEAKASCSKWGDWAATGCDDWAVCMVTDLGGYQYSAHIALDKPAINEALCYEWYIGTFATVCDHTGIDLQVSSLGMDMSTGEFITLNHTYQDITCTNPLAEGELEWPYGIVMLACRVGYGC